MMNIQDFQNRLEASNNEKVPMIRRYHPHLSAKVLKRDSNIVEKIIRNWDEQQNRNKDLLPIFLKEHKNLSDERYWELLRTVWIISGTVENTPIFKKLMQSNRKEKYCFSTPEEAKELRELPEQMYVYRATNDENDGGIAWTIKEEYAEYYKQAFYKEKIIKQFVIKKHIFAYINRNMEYEVIIF